jgi:hypothetical protein
MVDDKKKKAIIKKINKKLLESLGNYRKFLNYAAGDVPIGCLCVNPIIEKILHENGFERVYDLFNTDLTKIKGLGRSRLGELTTRLQEFIAMQG